MDKKKVQKGLLIGLGAISLTKKKAKKLAGILAKNRMMGKNDAKALAGKVMSEIKKANAKLDKAVVAEIRRQLAKAKPAVKRYGTKAGREGKKIAKNLAKKAEKIAKQIGDSLK